MQREDYDLYDVLAELGWGMNPRTRQDRALAVPPPSPRIAIFMI